MRRAAVWLLVVGGALAAGGCPAGLPPSSRPDTTATRFDLGYQDVYVPSSTPDTSWLPGQDGAPPDGARGDATVDADGQAPPPRPDAPRPADATVDHAPPDQTVDQPPPTGAWVQANQQDCGPFCLTLGKTNVAAPDGPHCMSGERRPASGIAAGIVFTYGCWPNCAAQGAFAASSVGKFCYSPGQKHDNDATDRTVGCYCK